MLPFSYPAVNPNVSELETLLDPSLPEEFELWVPDAWFKGLLKAGLVFEGTTKPVPETFKRLSLRVMKHLITLRSDSDGDYNPGPH